MSTGAECAITEDATGDWYYSLQRYPYGHTEEYDDYGPFPTLVAARKHLRRNHANPGGMWIEPCTEAGKAQVKADDASSIDPRGSIR